MWPLWTSPGPHSPGSEACPGCSGCHSSRAWHSQELSANLQRVPSQLWSQGFHPCICPKWLCAIADSAHGRVKGEYPWHCIPRLSPSNKILLCPSCEAFPLQAGCEHTGLRTMGELCRIKGWIPSGRTHRAELPRTARSGAVLVGGCCWVQGSTEQMGFREHLRGREAESFACIETICSVSSAPPVPRLFTACSACFIHPAPLWMLWGRIVSQNTISMFITAPEQFAMCSLWLFTHQHHRGRRMILAWQCSEQRTLTLSFFFLNNKRIPGVHSGLRKEVSVAALGSAQGHWALLCVCLADPSEPLWDRHHGAALLWQMCRCCWTSKNPGQVQERAGGHLMRHESIRAGSCICTAWLAAASRSQWEVLLGSRKEQYDKRPVIYAQWKMSKHPG